MSAIDTLIIGANGFFGGPITRCLQASGRSLVAVGGRSSADRFDVTDPAQVKTLMQRHSPKEVVYLAGVPDAQHSIEHVVRSFAVNVSALANVLEEGIAAGTRRLIHCGSLKQYGDSPAPYHEVTELRPRTTYAITKCLAEQLLEQYAAGRGIRYVALRISTVYGPGQTDPVTLIPATIRSCLTGSPIVATEGRQTRDFLFVDDLAECFAAILGNEDLTGVFNVGSGTPQEIRGIVERVHAMTYSKSELRLGALPYRQNEIWSMACNADKLYAATGWRGRTLLDEGLRKTIEAFSSAH
jgi:nucleoside-diphosphate-sugar epimerase